MTDKSFLEDEFPKYIDLINDNLERRWGLMTAQHLIEHLSLLFVISNGKIAAPSMIDEEKIPKFQKGFFEDKKPFIKNFSPTREPIIMPLKYDTMDEAKSVLRKSYERYLRHQAENPDIIMRHPTLGELGFERWNEFHRRHIEHHLMQFSLMDER